MNDSHSGVVLRVDAPQRRLTKPESLLNGRVVLLSEMIAVDVVSESGKDPALGVSRVILRTSEDEITLAPHADDADAARQWQSSLQTVLEFSRVPPPASVSISNSSGRSGSGAQHHIPGGFSMSSGAVFMTAGDVAVFLEGMKSVADKVSVCGDLATHLQTVFKQIPEVKCNKEAVTTFAERLEDIVRVLADPNSGVITTAKEADFGLLRFHVTSLDKKICDFSNFLQTLVGAGWLTVCIRAGASLKQKFESFDSSIVSVVNVLVRALGDPDIAFTKKEYSNVVDVKKSVDALGSPTVICHDPVKIRALARLIQSDGSQLQEELEDMVQLPLSHSSGSKASMELFTDRESSSETATASFSVSGGGSSGASAHDNASTSASWRSWLCCSCCYSTSAVVETQSAPAAAAGKSRSTASSSSSNRRNEEDDDDASPRKGDNRSSVSSLVRMGSKRKYKGGASFSRVDLEEPLVPSGQSLEI